MSKKLFVGSLSWNTTDEGLRRKVLVPKEAAVKPFVRPYTSAAEDH